MKKRRYWFWNLFLSLIAGAGLVWAGWHPGIHLWSGEILRLILIAIVAELFLVHSPPREGDTDRWIWLSISTPIVASSIVLYGWAVGVWVDALTTLCAGAFTIYFKNSHLRWVWFNTTQSILSALYAGGLATAVLALAGAEPSRLSLTIALLMALVAYNLMNTLLVSANMALLNNRSFRWVLNHSLQDFPRELLAITLLTLVVFLMMLNFGTTGLVMVVAPYLALRQAFVLWTRQYELYRQTIRSLGFLVQRAHPYTGGHLQRVALWARKTAEKLGLPPEQCDRIYIASLLHDLGKTVLDERILNKPGRLTPSEWKQIKRHPQLGAEILKDVPFLSSVVPWIAYHHERPDGKGYPYGLKGDQIPLEASIIAVVDAFDAMIGGEAPSQQRQYRRPLSVESALKELWRGAGTQFNEQVVQVFDSVVRRWQSEGNSLSHALSLEETGERSGRNPEGTSIAESGV